MKTSQVITAATLTLSVLSGSFNSIAANDCPEVPKWAEVASITSVIGFGALVLYDIATAPWSAKRYNESLARVQIGHRPLVPSVHLHSHSQPVVYAFKPSTSKPSVRQEKSPMVAFLLSLGATVIPVAVGNK